MELGLVKALRSAVHHSQGIGQYPQSCCGLASPVVSLCQQGKKERSQQRCASVLVSRQALLYLGNARVWLSQHGARPATQNDSLRSPLCNALLGGGSHGCFCILQGYAVLAA